MNTLDTYGLTDRFSNEATLYPDLHLARVIAQYRGLYKVVTEHGDTTAEISGKFRFNLTELEKFPTVGDFVMVSCDNAESNAVIHYVLTRKSVFLRTAVGVSGQAQSVAANIDNVFICMSLNNNFNLSRLERYLSVAWDSGATPVVLLTKSDLCDDLVKIVESVEKISHFADVIPVSMFDDQVENKLIKYIQAGSTSAFIGSSGVGKSTLINKLLGEDTIATADIGKADKGRHTTTGRELFTSPFGGVLIDTPGMRELGAESVDLERTFDDIEQLASQCKFHDCNHISEPGCAILQALENGSLDSRRYQSYCKLKTEVGYDGLTSREIEAKKFERFGGVKKIRKIGKELREINRGIK